MNIIRISCPSKIVNLWSFKIPKVNDKSNAENVENWDSLTHVQLVSALEKKFKIKISAEEGIDAFNNFKQLVSFVEKKLKIK